jgi:hypothetical protein
MANTHRTGFFLSYSYTYKYIWFSFYESPCAWEPFYDSPMCLIQEDRLGPELMMIMLVLYHSMAAAGYKKRTTGRDGGGGVNTSSVPIVINYQLSFKS